MTVYGGTMRPFDWTIEATLVQLAPAVAMATIHDTYSARLSMNSVVESLYRLKSRMEQGVIEVGALDSAIEKALELQEIVDHLIAQTDKGYSKSPHKWQANGILHDPHMLSTTPTVWSGFYNKTIRERHDVMHLVFPKLLKIEDDKKLVGMLSPKTAQRRVDVGYIGNLHVQVANLMIENCVGVLGLPLGLGLNFCIDGKPTLIPMVVEEPSVIAAASSAAKLISANGGFQTYSTGTIMTGQVQLVDIMNMKAAVDSIQENEKQLIDFANENLCLNMKKRGGGVIGISTRQVAAHTPHFKKIVKKERAVSSLDDYLVVHIDVDVCEAMGANVVNTIAEGLSGQLCILAQAKCGLRILTNYCVKRMVKTSFEVPLDNMKWKEFSGTFVASKIVQANHFGIEDPYRACTNNKGIMNGMDAVAIATGQDWRAIEAAAHCHAVKNGKYRALGDYELVVNSNGVQCLKGTLQVPMAVGTKGGALQTHPAYSTLHALMGKPSSSTLAGIIASVGLAQNFAALRAIATTGIQQGHMSLHVRNIACAAGAPSELVPEVCNFMLDRESISLDTAVQYISAHAIFTELENASPPNTPEKVRSQPSIFFVQVLVPPLKNQVSLNIAFTSLAGERETIVIVDNADGNPKLAEKHVNLLGDKGYLQLQKMLSLLETMKYVIIPEDSMIPRSNIHLQNKLKLVSILINLLTYQMLLCHKEVAMPFLQSIIAKDCIFSIPLDEKSKLLKGIPIDEGSMFCTAGPLLITLLQVFNYHIEQEIHNTMLKSAILREQETVFRYIIYASQDLQRLPEISPKEGLLQFMDHHAKRWQATLFLLITALSLNENVIDSLMLERLRLVGQYLEWEGTIAHDIAKVDTYCEANAILVYHRIKMKFSSVASPTNCTNADLLSEFSSLTDKHAQHLWMAIWTLRGDATGKIFSLSALSNSVERIRRHYGQRHLKHRTDSF